VKPAAFAYHTPASAADAVALLAELGDGAKVIAGGQSLVPMLALRLAVFDHLVDLRRVAGLTGIERREGSLWIGAATTQSEIGRSGLVAAEIPLLARATPLIGHFQIRNRGTIGGSLAHADAAAEYPAVALTLGAVIETTSPRGQRTIPAAGFFHGIWTTALEPDELLTGVVFPPWGGAGGRCGFAVEEFARRPGDFAIAGAAVAVELSGGGSGGGPRVRRCAIGLFGLGQTAVGAPAAEAAATGAVAADLSSAASAREIGAAAMAELDSVPSDLHGSAAYRRRVGAAVTAEAWLRALAEADEQAGARPGKEEPGG
jgi:carbon-monoxide dehydrogenase medium subunit